MKLLHLSDLHIGKRVSEFSMLEDQEFMLNQITGLALEQQVDGVLLAGDLYDKPIPPAEGVGLLDDFLTSLADHGLPVFAISGNHDSPERLRFGTRLLEDRGVYMAARYEDPRPPVVLRDRFGEVRIYLLPYLKPAAVRHVFPEAEIADFSQAMEYAVSRLEVDPAVRNVVVAHQFVTGGTVCDAEEHTVGGLDQISGHLFDAFDYVALGHLHRPQKILRETMRYCGAPLQYSFSEAGQQKSACLVTLEEKGSVSVEELLLHPLRALREIWGSYQQVTARDFYRDTPVEDYLHVILTDEEDIPEAVGRLRTIYPNLMQLTYDNTRTRMGRTLPEVDRPETKSPMELFQAFYRLQNNQPMGAEAEAYLAGLIEKIWEGETL